MKFMKPRLEHSRRIAEIARRNVPWIPDTQKAPKQNGFEQIAIAAGLQDEPQEVRTAAVKVWWEKEREATLEAGEKAERLRNGTKTSEKPMIDSKDRPWNDREALKASMLRINEFEQNK